MSPWTRLEIELDRWLSARREATLWWRDDDAITRTAALDRLLALAARSTVPLGLAVVPSGADQSLVEAVASADGIGVLQHGFAHRNHAPAGEKSVELGRHRPAERVVDDIRRGRDLVAGLFAECETPILVPPWNRIDSALLPRLADLGLRGLSTFAARSSAIPTPGIRQTNTHVDIIDWRGTRGFRGIEAVVDATVEHLRGRREGAVDPAEPTGLLTHHLDHDDACWAFLEDFLDATRAHPAVRWLDPAEAIAA